MTSTHHPALRSFIPVMEDSHFPIQNLPYAVFRPQHHDRSRIGVAIGDYILDLSIIEKKGFFIDIFEKQTDFFSDNSMNRFMALGRQKWHPCRELIQDLLSDDNPRLRDDTSLRNKALLLQKNCTFYLPAQIGDYTDFYASRHHAENIGRMFRGQQNALFPNWLHLPVAYHGRSSSIIADGTAIRRPFGQVKYPNIESPILGPTQALDFELEMGLLIGPGNKHGVSIPVEKAADHIFGLILVNDWSARDIQRWEYQPLGPFLGKNFATSVSPWVVTLDALQPFRCPAPEKQEGVLPYLAQGQNWTLDIELEVFIQSSSMKRPKKICKTNALHLYWDMCQQIAHHTVNGCNLRTGDLLASGTISGPTPESYGSLLELSQNGAKPLELSDSETRTFLEDGDTVIMCGWCQGEGYRIGFGTLRGQILPAENAKIVK